MPLKDKGRILGLDDGPFHRPTDKSAPFVGVLMRMDGRIEGIRFTRLMVDGDSAEMSIVEMVESLGSDNINLIMSEGITFAGFDIVEPEEIFRKTGIPFVSKTQSAADIGAMETALSKYGELEKISKLRKLAPARINMGGTDFTVNYAGIPEDEVMKILEKSTFVGNTPEPVRIAHMLSEALFRYEKP